MIKFYQKFNIFKDLDKLRKFSIMGLNKDEKINDLKDF